MTCTTCTQILRTLPAIGVWFVLVWVFCLATSKLFRVVVPSDVVALKFLSETKEDIGKEVVARARFLVSPVPLDRLPEVRVPPLFANFKTVEVGLDNVLGRVEVKGVDLSGLVKLLSPFLQAPAQRITATTTPNAISIVWTDDRDNPLRSWVVQQRPAVAVDPARDKQELIDRAIYQIMYYANNLGKGSSMTTPSFPSPEALEAFQAGKQHLLAYQTERDPNELDRAEERLKYLRGEMPGFRDGLVLLGITLSEQRKEQEAISVFDQIISRKTADAPEYESQLLRATAYRKLYRIEDNTTSLRILDVLISEIQTKIDGISKDTGKDANDEVRTSLMKLALSAKCERVSALGHYLVLLGPISSIERLVSDNVPEKVRLTAEEREELERVKGKPDGLRELYLKVHTRLFRVQEDAFDQTAKDLEADKALLGPGADIGSYESRLYNARGYARFRYAQTRPTMEDFATYAMLGYEDLRTADAKHPNDYMVLQNLATLLLDWRFDIDGRYLAEATELLRRSLKIKPRDYWGHEQLALSTLRKAKVFGTDSISNEDLNEAIKAIERAQEYRPTGTSGLPIRAALYVVKWERDAANRAAIGDTIDTTLGLFRARNGAPYQIALVRVQFALAQARQASSSQEFDTAVGRLYRDTKVLETALATESTSPDIKSLGDGLATLIQMLSSKPHFEDRKELIWPLVTLTHRPQ